MENLTHSRQPNRAGSTLAAKKPCNNGGGGGFVPATKSLYDDVYGGPPKFGMAATLSPRAEDYSEIFESFHASRASSIPVLDLPAVDEAEAEVFFDVQSSGFDYSEVFGGGFDGLDCAASFEDLLYDGSNGRNVHSSSSSEEAWTPAGSGSLSEESDHFEKNHCLSNEDCYQSFDGDVEFNISYHKANLASNEDMSSRTRHMSELHAVPGFAFAYDENDPLQKIEDDIPFLQVTDDDNLNMDFSVGMKKGKHLKKTISQPLNGIVDEQAFEYNLKPDKVYRRSGSLPNGFVTVSDISLRTQPSQLPPPSRPPPGADVTTGGSSRLIPNGKSVASEGTADDSSPPFFDVEVDASSSAAASAAAMKEAMVKAQAKLRSAKEFMDRKKEGFQGSSKTGSKNHNVQKVEKMSKIVDECDSLRDEGLQSSCDREDNGMKFSVREEKQKVMTAQEVLDSVGEKLLKVAKESAEKRLGKKSRSSLGSAKIDGGSEWKEESQFFELVRTDKSDKALEQTNHVQISVHNTKILERGQKEKTAVMGVFDQQEENNRKMKSARGNHELEFEKKSKVAHEAFEGEENNGRSKAAKEAHRQKGHAKKEKVAQEVSKQVENVKKVRIAQKPLETETKSTGVDVLENCNNLVEVLLKDYSFEVEQAMKHKENNEQKLKDSNKQRESEKRLKESCEREDDEKRRSEFFGWEENEEVLKEDLLRAEDEKRLKESHEQKESEKRLKEEVIEWDENEKKQKEACKRQEDEKRFIEALEQEENKKRLQKVLEQEEHEKRLKETLEWKEDEMKLKEFHKGEENEKRLEEALQWEESGKKQEACEREENEKRLRDACEKEDEKILYGASEQVANSDKLKGAQERREPGRRSKEGFEQEESKKESKEASTWEETENRLKDAGRKEEQKGLNKAHEQTMGDNNGKVQKLAKGDCVRMEGEDLGVSDVAQKLENNDNAQAPKLACTNDKNSRKLEETQEALAHEENGKTKSEPKDKEKDSKTVKTANVLVGENLNRFRTEDAKKSPHLDDGVRKAGEPGIGVGQMHIFKSKSLSQLDSDPINKERKFAHEWGERGNNIKQTHAVSNQEESKDRFVSTHVMKDGVENGRKLEAQPAMMEIKGNIQKPAMRVNASQTTERKEKNLNETLTSEDIETERMKREREMEMERLRKIEEEIEREREREKDRMAVDRATLEARERAYTEARDRAERAAVERAMAEARERLEKACAEARDKTFTEKATMEAKLRAERAAKARERAAEKAMADKAAFETRERIDRSVSDKFLDSFRNSGMKQSSSVVYGGVEVETAQRCKARLERHQRTTERAAKALAEKNMRDLLAQREQTERNRLAETLDADVRRWSSGKEGNLRALLSTLQYILGPDSGWQPIPLTEVITSAAVKKAYRKATLCVHPDKLQQRAQVFSRSTYVKRSLIF